MPRRLIFMVAPRPPIDQDVPRLPQFKCTPGRILILRLNRKPIVRHFRLKLIVAFSLSSKDSAALQFVETAPEFFAEKRKFRQAKAEGPEMSRPQLRDAPVVQDQACSFVMLLK
jgi:hypothetical protein